MARAPRGKLIAEHRQEVSVLGDGGMYRRIRTAAVYQLPNGTHELHLGERWIGGEDVRTVEPFETFHDAHRRTEATFGVAYASALIDSLLDRCGPAPVKEGATV